MTYTTTNDQGRARQSATIEGALCHAAAMIYMGDQARQQARDELSKGNPFTVAYGFKTVTITPIIDPHQAAEAAAFSLMPSTGPAQVDTTADMFGYDAEDLEHWQASRCASRLRQPSASSLGLFD